jgi:hypothetical protein
MDERRIYEHACPEAVDRCARHELRFRAVREANVISERHEPRRHARKRPTKLSDELDGNRLLDRAISAQRPLGLGLLIDVVAWWRALLRE